VVVDCDNCGVVHLSRLNLVRDGGRVPPRCMGARQAGDPGSHVPRCHGYPGNGAAVQNV